MTPHVVGKLQSEIKKGLKEEAQVVYLLAGIRKIIERENKASKFDYLNFHCDWVLHSKLDRWFAQKVLNQFDSVHISQIKSGGRDPLSRTIDNILNMEQFREQMSGFLKSHSLADFSQDGDTWAKFLYLYSRVIEDIPLVISPKNSASIQQITISVKISDQPVNDHKVYKISWHITGKDGSSGEVFVINSFPD